MQPAFHHKRVASYTIIMREVAEDTVASWQPGQVVHIDQAVNDLALAAVAKSLFAAEIGAHAVRQLESAMPIVMRGVMLRTALPAVWDKLPTAGNRRYNRAIAAMNQAIGETIAAYRSDGTDHGDLLSMLLTATDDSGRVLTDQQVHDQVITIVVAAAETTAAELAWALYEISTRPEIEQRVHAELEAVLDGRSPTWEDLPALEYTGRVIAESLRLHASWLIMRSRYDPPKRCRKAGALPSHRPA